MYRELESILKSDEYLEDLRFELEHSNPNYLTVLEKRIKDMEKSDHGIVVAGKWDFVNVNLKIKLIYTILFYFFLNSKISLTMYVTIKQCLPQTHI